ncbi:MAG: D-alanyl-D-alanine carboxypeptidase/D-alanyl-D-alanine-endopeptidase (penicillin-binding protein 4) [Planctomycetota bacterium]|jgi:D-alanyl-D-alanine carboxypeptidase/D-alanyl-D-alanine-endopeptidase (penicillin-binding protein 4)
MLLSVLLCVLLCSASCGENASAATGEGARGGIAIASGAQVDGALEVTGDDFEAVQQRSAEQRAAAQRSPLSGHWTEPLRAIVGRWFSKANQVTKGKANGGNIGFGLQVVDLETGIILAAIGADRPRRPASNLKLVTTAAALVLFGTEADFLTSCEANGEVVDGRLGGDLILRASGDPIVNRDSDPRVEDRFLRAAREVRESGVRVIAGDLVLDEGTFQTPAPGPAWPDPSQHWQEYCALSGGFSVNGGVMIATVSPTQVGKAARVDLHPVPHGLRSIIRPMTIRKGSLTIGAEARQGRVLVQGNIAMGTKPFGAEFSHEDPVLHFGTIFAWALGQEGVTLEGSIVRERNTPIGKRIAAIRSSVAATLYPINAESRNGVADQLFLAMGHAVGQGGTRSGGQEATRSALEQLGVSVEGLHQVDGSGLSFDNAIAPAQVTGLLAGAMRLGPEARECFLDSLAVAGSIGTLESRMRGTSAVGRVMGKSGWIRGTSALSGIIRTLDGRELAFSFLIEYPPAVQGLNRSVLKPMMDELCVYLVEANFTKLR